MSESRRKRIVALVIVLLVPLATALFLVFSQAGGDDDGAEGPGRESAGAPERAAEPRAPRTRDIPREHVAATPDETARPPAEGETDAGTSLPGLPIGSPVAPTRTVRVLVVHEGGVPVRDAHVAAFSAFGHISVEPEGAVTDVEGRVTLKISGTANFRVRAWTRDLAAVGERVTADPDATLDVTLTLEPAGPVAGRVVSDDASTPIEAARVTLRLPGEDAFGLSLSEHTDAEGGFAFGTLPSSLLTSKEAHVTADARGHARFEAPFTELGRTPDDIVLRLERGLVVIGRCVATGAAPVADVRVQASGYSGLVMSAGNGRFELDGVSQSGADIELFPPEHVCPPPIRVEPGAGEVDLGDIILADGQPISGVVVDDQEKPVQGAVVHAFEQERRREVRSTTTDADGRFTLGHIGEGPHIVIAMQSAGGDWSSRVSGSVEDVTAGTAGVRVVLTGGLSLLVEFLRESDREPVQVGSAEVEVTRTDVEAGKTVSAWAGPGMTSVRVTFQEAGRYTVVVKVPGHLPATLEDVEILADRPVRIEALFRKEPD